MNDVRDALVADELQRAVAHSPFNRTLQRWVGLLDRSISFEALADSLQQEAVLSFLAIDTTGSCDLTCPSMCYYHPGIDTRRAGVSIHALKTAISDAQRELSLRTLVFSGKEPLVNAQRLFELAEFANNIQDRKFSVGLVTNGRLLARHWPSFDSLVAAGGLSFLDISLDSGYEAEHDRIRGLNGTWSLAMAALRRCIEHWPSVRVGIASVLRHDNADGLLQLVRVTSDFNRVFFFAPIQPPPFTATPPVGWSKIFGFVKALVSLLALHPPKQPLEITFSLLGLYIRDAVTDGLFRWRDIREDANGQCYARLEIAGHSIIFLLQVLPETGHAIARIAADGSYLPNTHFLQAATPWSYAIGSIKDERIPALYARALGRNGVLYQLLASREGHECSQRACWKSCFGGLANAETELVAGRDLKRQPALCLKEPRGGQHRAEGVTCIQNI